MNRQNPEQIVQLFHDVDEELGKSKAVEDICREIVVLNVLSIEKYHDIQ